MSARDVVVQTNIVEDCMNMGKESKCMEGKRAKGEWATRKRKDCLGFVGPPTTHESCTWHDEHHVRKSANEGVDYGGSVACDGDGVRYTPNGLIL